MRARRAQSSEEEAVSEEEVVSMRISYRRSGGVAGMTRTYRVSSDDLPPETADELRRFVRAADFFALPETMTSGAGRAADAFTSTISVTWGDRTASVTTSDAAAPDALRPLLAWLDRQARTSREARSEEE